MKKKSWKHWADQTFRLLLQLCFFLSNKLDYWNKLETTFSWLKICWGSKWMAVPVHNWSPTPASKVFEREAIRKYVYIPSNRRTNTFCKCELSGMMCGCFFPWAASWRLAKQLFSFPPLQLFVWAARHDSSIWIFTPSDLPRAKKGTKCVWVTQYDEQIHFNFLHNQLQTCAF